MLEQRKEKIKKDLSDAKTDKEEAAKLRAEYEEKVNAADKEAEGILASSRQRALQNEEKILEEARQDARQMKELAQKEIDLEKERVKDDLKKEMVQLASAMAGKVVSSSMDVEIQDSLVEETLNEMSEKTWEN